jgi:hypothetical protein
MLQRVVAPARPVVRPVARPVAAHPAHPARWLTGLFLLALPLGGCDCTEVTVKVAPQIYVDACLSPEKRVGDKLIGGFQECALPFGEADLSIRTSRTVVITNPSNLQLNLLSVELVGDPNFELADVPPTSIGAGLSAQIAVQIRPVVASAIEAELVIISDANNTPKNADGNSEIRIPLTLTGVDRGVPDIEVVPQGCGSASPLGIDFGNVAASGVQVCNLEIRNVGTRELFFDAIAFVTDDAGNRTIVEPVGSTPEPAFSMTGALPDTDTALRPTAADVAPLALRVVFAPDVLGRFDDVLRIVSSDPDEGTIDIPVAGIGVTGPQCVARVKTVNGIPPDGAPEIEPLDDVVLTTEGSTGSAGDVAITGTRWEIRERGPGSSAVLSSPNTTETGFRFANRAGVDVAGRFEVCAVVTDSLGTDSINECCVDFEAIPSDAFLVQLTWAEPTDDMDLHVTKADATGRFCADGTGSPAGTVDAPYADCSNDLDCYYGNCKPGTFGDTPEWDGVPGRGEGDPSLDVDDVDGFGPENTNVNEITPGSYAFAADYYRGTGPHTVFIRLFIFGQLRGEWVETIDDEFFEVGIVHFTADAPLDPCIEDLTDGDPDDECPGN